VKSVNRRYALGAVGVVAGVVIWLALILSLVSHH